MSEKKDIPSKSSPGESYRVVKERLRGTNTDLAGFSFHRGANLYVFSYEKGGERRHTFVDAGDSRYRDKILTALVENDINPGNIERIIITHRHPDHCGLAELLARESGAKILVHSRFRSFVEGEIGQEERRWLGDFDPSRLKECDIEYLLQSKLGEVVSIGGVDFPILIEPVEIGEAGKLAILACPESIPTHSPDQIIVLYSAKNDPYRYEERYQGFRPTDDILFSGDLWLMRGPLYDWGMRDVVRQFRYGFHQIKGLMPGRSVPRRDPREQDARTKEALKRGFSLIRVKPGHGEEFLGSRIMPNSLMAECDLLIELGYSMDADKSILRSREVAPRVATIMEQAYTRFIEELLLWKELGYTSSEISGLLVRIYKEQSGGGPLVEKDRKERRERLKATLARLRDDETKPDELHRLAETTLSALGGVS